MLANEPADTIIVVRFRRKEDGDEKFHERTQLTEYADDIWSAIEVAEEVSENIGTSLDGASYRSVLSSFILDIEAEGGVKWRVSFDEKEVHTKAL